MAVDSIEIEDDYVRDSSKSIVLSQQRIYLLGNSNHCLVMTDKSNVRSIERDFQVEMLND